MPTLIVRHVCGKFPGHLPRGCLHRRENPSRERERADVPAPAQEVAGAPRSDAADGSSEGGGMNSPARGGVGMVMNLSNVPGIFATH